MAKRSHVTIGTHDGTFHCDEALGCFMLLQTAEFKDAEIVRTRDAAKLADLDVVIDVGGVYDPEKKRFDHHQREFDGVFGHGHSTKLSSAGLVYKHYGQEIVAKLLGMNLEDPKAAETVKTIWLKVYKSFMEAIDGIDNGVNQWVSDEPPRYTNSTDLSSRAGKLNPAWNEEYTAETMNAGFMKAVNLTGEEFSECVRYYGKVWLPGRQYVVEAVEGRHNVHASGEIFQLPRYCPWKDHLYDVEKELACDPPLKYCLYEDDKGNWRIQCVSVTAGSFENRRSLPAAWRGVRDSELDAVSGIEGCIFVHAGGFIGGNKTLEGAKAMAIKALELD